MLPKTLGIDITDSEVSAVLTSAGLHGRRIEACHSVALARGQDPAPAIAEVVRETGAGGAALITAAPVAMLGFQTLTLPFRNPKKIRQTLAFELEPKLPRPVAELQIDFYPVATSRNESRLLIATIEKSGLDRLLAPFKENGLAPRAMEIRGHAPARLLAARQPEDTAILLESGADDSLTIIHKGQAVLVRACHLPESDPRALIGLIRHTLHAHGAGHRLELQPRQIFITGSKAHLLPIEQLAEEFACPVKSLDLAAELAIKFNPQATGQWRPEVMNTALALALGGSKPGRGFNFLTGAYQQQTRSAFRHARELGKAAVWSGLLLALLLGQSAYEYQHLHQRYLSLGQQSMQLFQQMFPEVQRVVEPLHQLRVMIQELQREELAAGALVRDVTFVDLLNDISARTPTGIQVRISHITSDTDGIRLRGTTDNFNTVDALKQNLATSPNFTAVSISTATVDRQNNVAFELRLQRTTSGL